MLQSLRRPLVAGVLLVVLALVVSACAANGAAAPQVATPGTSSSATTAPLATEATTSGTGATNSPLATSTDAATSTTQPTETAIVQATSTTTTTEATATIGTSADTTPAATGTVESGGSGTATATPGATTPGSNSGGAATIEANGISQATYTAVEYSFQGPDQLPAGWTQITLDNQGAAAHDLQLFGIDAGKTLQDVTQSLASNGPPDWAHAYGSIFADPGKQESFIVDLAPGNYVLLSFGNNQQGPPDAAKGMLKMVTVTGIAPAASSVQLPTPDVSINMVDYHFEMTGTMKSGSQTIYLTNTGTEMHEAQVLKLNAGTTFEQFQQLLMASNGQQGSQMPATPVWGMTLSPGASAYGTANLTPGEYAVVCFLPSAKNGGKPHYMLGMISSVTVK